MLFLGLADGNSGYAWANNPVSPSYTPDWNWSDNLNGSITATRLDTGTYEMRFGGLGGIDSGGTVLVSAYGSIPAHCSVGSWLSAGSDFVAGTWCFGPDNNRLDTRYTVLAVWPDRLTAHVFANGFESTMD